MDESVRTLLIDADAFDPCSQSKLNHLERPLTTHGNVDGFSG